MNEPKRDRLRRLKNKPLKLSKQGFNFKSLIFAMIRLNDRSPPLVITARFSTPVYRCRDRGGVASEPGREIVRGRIAD
jgi:hypothetical protein